MLRWAGKEQERLLARDRTQERDYWKCVSEGALRQGGTLFNSPVDV